MEQLANPAWHALTGPQSGIAERGPLAARFDPTVSVFAAVPDDANDEAWGQLAELVGAGNVAVVMRERVDRPDGWTERFGGAGAQMIWRDSRSAGSMDGSDDGTAPSPGFDVVRLGVGDVPEMVGLVARTQPGPFSARTIELGTYLGVRDTTDGRLVAMAGQRLHPPGHVEISAVCTDLGFRGRGLARLVVARLIEEIRSAGEVPILHVAETNTGAIHLYESMGFDTLRQVHFVALEAPSAQTSAIG
jgi:ribosomal protein S18 acetylase RimI-like enzyme